MVIVGCWCVCLKGFEPATLGTAGRFTTDCATGPSVHHHNLPHLLRNLRIQTVYLDLSSGALDAVAGVTDGISTMHQCSLFILTLLCVSVKDISGSWEEWWTYDGISGPGFWGLINPQWSMCNKGRRQSPVNIEPDKLLFDPWLRDIQFDKHKVSGVLQNTGQSLVFRVEKDSKHQVNISGGPLSYRYQFEEIYFHYGMEDNRGSEHQIDHHTFPGEIQLYGFNKELYHNMSEAQHKSQGVVGISLMVQIGEPTNKELRLITSAFNKVIFRGSSFPIKHLPLSSLLPTTQQYLTYEGSTTHPGCWETAVWIIFNKPIYISKQEMYALRRLVQGSQLSPKAPLGNNARPVQPLHHRTVRTNINFNKQGVQVSSNCPDMYRNMHYTATQWPREHSMRYRSAEDLAMLSPN